MFKFFKNLLKPQEEQTDIFVDLSNIFKSGFVHIPKNMTIKLPSLKERIKSIPYQSLSDDLLFEIWECVINEMNRRKKSEKKKNDKDIEASKNAQNNCTWLDAREKGCRLHSVKDPDTGSFLGFLACGVLNSSNKCPAYEMIKKIKKNMGLHNARIESEDEVLNEI